MSNHDNNKFWLPIYGLIASITVGFFLGVLNQIAFGAAKAAPGLSVVLILIAWMFIEVILALFIPYQNKKIWNFVNLGVLFLTYWFVVENFGVGGWGAA